jgi:tetratricopeptide (TPR) repeat protein
MRGFSLLFVAAVDAYEGKHEQALRHRQEAIALSRTTASAYDLLAAQLGAADSHRRLGRPQEAFHMLREALPRVLDLRDPWALIACADTAIRVLVDAGLAEVAARLAGAADAMRDQLGVTRTRLDEVAVAEAVRAGRAQLGQRWSDLETAGRQDTVENVLADLARAVPAT